MLHCRVLAVTSFMFFNFKKKIKLIDSIPQGYTDIHCHVIPGIDDGAKNFDDSANLLTEMRNMGFSTIIGTPHTLPGVWNNTTKSITTAHQALENEHKALCNSVSLRVASEYLLDSSYFDTVPADSLLTLKGQYLLIEMSYLNPPLSLQDLLFAIQMKGFVPILAHPERYLYYHQDKKQYQMLKDSGCYFQLNLLSTVGYYGKSVANAAEYLLKQGMIDYTGSDIHHMRHVKAFHSHLQIKSVAAFEKAIEANQFFS